MNLANLLLLFLATTSSNHAFPSATPKQRKNWAVQVQRSRSVNFQIYLLHIDTEIIRPYNEMVEFAGRSENYRRMSSWTRHRYCQATAGTSTCVLESNSVRNEYFLAHLVLKVAREVATFNVADLMRHVGSSIKVSDAGQASCEAATQAG